MAQPTYKQQYFFATNANQGITGLEFGRQMVESIQKEIPDDADIISVTHTQAGTYGEYFSVFIVYRVYLDDVL